jgi:N-dimethylarginine dimethylaminohydrolase
LNKRIVKAKQPDLNPIDLQEMKSQHAKLVQNLKDLEKEVKNLREIKKKDQ